jgi:hypothetical protein
MSDLLVTLATDKRNQIDREGQLHASIAHIRDVAAAEAEQFAAIVKQHEARQSYWQAQLRSLKAELGRCRQARAWLASHGL